MVKQGIVNLNHPVEKFLTVKYSQFNGKKITLERFGSAYPLHLVKQHCWALIPTIMRSIVSSIIGYQSTREPGAQVQYSSFGIGLLGHILSLKSGGVPYDS